MLIDIIDVKPQNHYVLWLKFEDGTEGTVDIKNLLGDFTGVFSKFKDLKYFQSVKIDKEIGTIAWPENIDLCPDVLYAAVKGLPKPNLQSIQSA